MEADHPKEVGSFVFDLARAIRKVDSLIRERDSLSRQIKSSKTELKEAIERVRIIRISQAIVQEVAITVEETAHQQIAAVVTRCFEFVFNVPYEFKIIFERKRGRTEARLVFLSGDEENDPLTASGGGVVDVAALALRIACLVLSQPPGRRILILDEPMKNVNGSEYQSRVGALVMTLAKEMDIQFIIVTDDTWLKIGTVVDLQPDE